MELLPNIHYLNPSDQDDDWQISCLDVGTVTVGPGDAYPPWPALHPPQYTATLRQGRVLQEYQLLFVSQGRGTLRQRQTTWEIEPGTAFLTFPGEPHSYSPDPSTGWVEYWVGFRGAYPDLLVKKGFFSPDEPLFPQGLGHSGATEYRSLLEEVSHEAPGHRILAASRVVSLLAKLVASRRSGRQEAGTAPIFEEARLILEDRIGDHDIDWVVFAQNWGLSYAAFSARFHAYTGLPPHRYWLGLKMARAQSLLLSGRSVKETAWAVGFENEFYFSRFFKKRAGVPPSRWGR